MPALAGGKGYFLTTLQQVSNISISENLLAAPLNI